MYTSPWLLVKPSHATHVLSRLERLAIRVCNLEYAVAGKLNPNGLS
jgi:hypothetical protein